MPTVNEHLKGIFAEGELAAGATVREFLIVRREGSREVERSIAHYNLPAILAVGYRVRSHRGTQFRQSVTDLFDEGRSLERRQYVGISDVLQRGMWPCNAKLGARAAGDTSEAA